MRLRNILGYLKAMRSERGGSLVEFAFVAPVMLIISGATIDIGRFLRYHQITSSISQEAANYVYRRCSDITSLTETNGQTTVDASKSRARILACAQRARDEAQIALNNALPGSLISITVYRHNIEDFYDKKGSSNTGTCAAGDDITSIQAPPSQDDKDKCGQLNRTHPSTARLGVNIGELIGRPKLTENSGNLLSGNTTIVSKEQVCNRNRLVAVEVGYAFEPIVKFLPAFLPGFGIDKEGVHRETTIL
jgi:Flp pilus assembly protein TadG